MNCIPSLIFKPKYILMLTPIKNANISNLLLSISYINNINQIILSGGVHTLSCVVFGTQNIKKVDKISGPANYYITLAKKELFGNVGIDMLAGPSELMIICDGKINPNIIAFDFFSQLEHDKNSQCILLSNNKNYIKILYNIIYKLLIFQKNKNKGGGRTERHTSKLQPPRLAKSSFFLAKQSTYKLKMGGNRVLTEGNRI
uniref:Histidinol dehydrogenase n=1 Tax=Cacopsylla melanoneura TaxID=428564 RepID=A0A8D8VEP6_9HEMI